MKMPVLFIFKLGKDNLQRKMMRLKLGLKPKNP